jgi:hypothetical protein
VKYSYVLLNSKQCHYCSHGALCRAALLQLILDLHGNPFRILKEETLSYKPIGRHIFSIFEGYSPTFLMCHSCCYISDYELHEAPFQFASVTASVMSKGKPYTLRAAERLTSGKANLPANRSVCGEFSRKVWPEIEPPINLQSLDFLNVGLH